MRIEGTVVEIGDLDGFDTPTPGVRMEVGGQIIEISGLTREQIKAMPPVIFKRVTLSLDSAT